MTEGRRRVPGSYLDSLDDDPPKLRYTGDTVMTIGVARSLVERYGDHMAGVLADVYRREPLLGYGSDPRSSSLCATRVSRGTPRSLVMRS